MNKKKNLVLCIVFLVSAVIPILYHIIRHQEPYNNANIIKESANEIALVYVGCSTCGPANHPDMPKKINLLFTMVDSIAQANNISFMTIGVSSEQNYKKGLKHLDFIYDRFDEIAIGNGLGNVALQKYIWENFEDHTAVGIPQVIILSRTYNSTQTQNNIQIHANIINEEFEHRAVGMPEISKLTKTNTLKSFYPSNNHYSKSPLTA
ncbi:MAG: hypothetical protein FH748_04935 [Balneolaceae bacterium]|nr:hypothetical protein [Balneolaceae bacterium]